VDEGSVVVPVAATQRGARPCRGGAAGRVKEAPARKPAVKGRRGAAAGGGANPPRRDAQSGDSHRAAAQIDVAHTPFPLLVRNEKSILVAFESGERWS